MTEKTVAVLGTFDSKGEEHLFLKKGIEARGLRAVTINVGTKGPASFAPDHDLRPASGLDRDVAIASAIESGRNLAAELFARGEIMGIISAGGGTGTHLATSIMKALPLGVPKVMLSTVASRDMSETVGTRDITMMHSVADLLGVNSITGLVLDRAAGAVCGMVRSDWASPREKKTVALTMFGFITEAAENIRARLEARGREVVAFHANGAGGLAMEELDAEGRFDAVLDLAVHELADSLKPGGYCSLIGPGRLEPVPGRTTPRLVIPGGLDCAVLEFTRETVPEEYRGRPIFFYDFRSAVRLSRDETLGLAQDLAEKLNRRQGKTKMIVPLGGWSEADREGGPLYDQALTRAFTQKVTAELNPAIEATTADLHINDPAFADLAANALDKMLEEE